MESASVQVYNIMKHVTVKLYIDIFKNFACVSHIAFAVFTIQVEILCRSQCKDANLSQCSFTIYLPIKTNCIQWYNLHSVTLGCTSCGSAYFLQISIQISNWYTFNVASLLVSLNRMQHLVYTRQQSVTIELSTALSYYADWHSPLIWSDLFISLQEGVWRYNTATSYKHIQLRQRNTCS
jgi:hypothetical protein